MSLTVNGVSFDGIHSFTNLGMWLSERPDTGAPEPKTSGVDVPGMDGELDFTEANAGEVKFHNRQMRFVFAAMVAASSQQAFISTVKNALHGKHFERIVLDEDNGWYYTGRATVSFDKLNDWKVKCTVSVDAAPYAMKKTETSVNLLSSAFSLRRVALGGENTSVQEWNSNIMLGTEQFPAGIRAVSAVQNLIIAWPTTTTFLIGTKHYYIYDSDGGSYTGSISSSLPVTAGEVNVPMSSITGAGVTPSKVYRVLVSGIGNCALYNEFGAAYTKVSNNRKNVIPVFNLVATDSVQIVVNGETFNIAPGIAQYIDIILRQGDNDIYVVANDLVTITSLTMTFREGKL